ncbi:MAG TPA: NosD domain-containing protein [Pyrinomonadaceae bacterium]|nr:NosD domain-containing protein [Pyrinomonadaceae bacterium]
MRKIFMQFASLLTSGSRGRHIMFKRVSLGILLAGVLSATAGVAQAGPPTGVTCGSLIEVPGQYFLIADCTGQGITIIASNVHLKLEGHTMTGLGILGLDGIFAVNVSHVHIQGPGTITNYGNGINFDGVTDSHVEQVSSTNNRRNGLRLNSTTDTHVNDNVFSMNTQEGVIVVLSSDNHVNNNRAIGNRYGIRVGDGSTGNKVNGNTALGNSIDLVDENPNCDNNKWNGNTFTTSFPPNCIR